MPNIYYSEDLNKHNKEKRRGKTNDLYWCHDSLMASSSLHVLKKKKINNNIYIYCSETSIHVTAPC